MNSTSIKFYGETLNLLDSLKESSRSTSRTEVIRKALFLLDLSVKAKRDGQRLMIVDEDNEPQTEIHVY